MKQEKMWCGSINYRKGFVEVSPNIHPGLVNIEITNIHPDHDISADEDIPDEAFVGNAEIELSILEAKELIRRLNSAIIKAESSDSVK